MANALAEALDQAKATGEVSVARLKELCDAEKEVLGNIAHDRSTAGNFMKVDTLEGDTNEAKSNNYVDRVAVHSEAEKFIAQQEATELLVKAQAEDAARRKALDAAGNQKTQTGEEMDRKTREQQPNNYVPATTPGLLKSLMPGFDIQGIQKSARDGKLSMRLPVDPEKLVKELKAVTTETVMPIDTFGRIYPMQTTLLDFIDVQSAPGQQMFYHEPPDPDDAAPTVGPRDIGDQLGDEAIEFTLRRLNKQSCGRRTRLDREVAMAHPAVMDRVGRALMVRQRRYIMNEVLNGTGGYNPASGNRWWGLLPHLNDQAQPGLNHYAVPAGTNEWVQTLETYMLTQWERDTSPNLIVVNHADWSAIRRAQRSQRYLAVDYNQFPYGDFDGTPLLPTNLMPANTLLMLNTEPGNLYIEFQSENMAVEMSDEVGFEENQLAFRITAYANVGLVAPASSLKITDTNNMNILGLA